MCIFQKRFGIPSSIVGVLHAHVHLLSYTGQTERNYFLLQLEPCFVQIKCSCHPQMGAFLSYSLLSFLDSINEEPKSVFLRQCMYALFQLVYSSEVSWKLKNWLLFNPQVKIFTRNLFCAGTNCVLFIVVVISVIKVKECSEFKVSLSLLTDSLDLC